MKASAVVVGLVSTVAVFSCLPGALGQQQDGLWARLRRAIGETQSDEADQQPGKPHAIPVPEVKDYSYPPYGYPPPPPSSSALSSSESTTPGYGPQPSSEASSSSSSSDDYGISSTAAYGTSTTSSGGYPLPVTPSSTEGGYTSISETSSSSTESGYSFETLTSGLPSNAPSTPATSFDRLSVTERNGFQRNSFGVAVFEPNNHSPAKCWSDLCPSLDFGISVYIEHLFHTTSQLYFFHIWKLNIFNRYLWNSEPYFPIRFHFGVRIGRTADLGSSREYGREFFAHIFTIIVWHNYGQSEYEFFRLVAIIYSIYTLELESSLGKSFIVDHLSSFFELDCCHEVCVVLPGSDLELYGFNTIFCFIRVTKYGYRKFGLIHYPAIRDSCDNSCDKQHYASRQHDEIYYFVPKLCIVFYTWDDAFESELNQHLDSILIFVASNAFTISPLDIFYQWSDIKCSFLQFWIWIQLFNRFIFSSSLPDDNIPRIIGFDLELRSKLFKRKFTINQLWQHQHNHYRLVHPDVNLNICAIDKPIAISHFQLWVVTGALPSYKWNFLDSRNWLTAGHSTVDLLISVFYIDTRSPGEYIALDPLAQSELCTGDNPAADVVESPLSHLKFCKLFNAGNDKRGGHS
ncbi:hypothetical protein B0T26DRAFT_670089 [Lasiosphaeria miniovina]|uniref:Uncharacterized protein n=1 Tax=Lasiosphaeria miniovina TaxID=1954250 RepID=A0AA40BGA4_9PEZI|nr:uncharacterized protein B0T26DRAFT_670089 [Lasiosphaeria miniovina]KAK0733710.1 hypothetical protein B0T26DRAFT_670089 [Lasiosphaeria miniovina]